MSQEHCKVCSVALNATNAYTRTDSPGKKFRPYCKQCDLKRTREWKLGLRPRLTRTERFHAAVSLGERDECWPFSPVNEDGYGKVGRIWAHRCSWELIVGPIPPGHDLDHLCRNRACVNPAHLEPVSRLINVRRGFAPNSITSRTGICKRGHAIQGDNVYTRPNGSKNCRACRKVRESAARGRHA